MADLVTGLVLGPGGPDEIDGVQLRHMPSSSDVRGGFAKPYTRPVDSSEVIREVFWSHSEAGVIRGMHVQGPRTASAKDIFLTSGRVYDVVLDIRASSPTFGQFVSFVLDPSVTLHIPHGCAHGFQAIEPASMVYLCDMPYDPESDHGIRSDSIGIPWPLTPATVSERDAGLPAWQDYETPFA